MGIREVTTSSPREIVLLELDAAVLSRLLDVDKALEVRCPFFADFFPNNEVSNLFLMLAIPALNLFVHRLFIIVQGETDSVASHSGHLQRYTDNQPSWTTF